jgi:hypothetical protein
MLKFFFPLQKKVKSSKNDVGIFLAAGFSCGWAGDEDPVGGLVQELPRIVQLPLLPPKNLEKN